MRMFHGKGRKYLEPADQSTIEIAELVTAGFKQGLAPNVARL